MVRRKIFILSIILFSCLVWLPTSLAQTPDAVIVIYPAVKENENNVNLGVFFTVTDEGGRPMPEANIESVDVQLLGGNDTPVTANFEEPGTPFHIILLLDASGSMRNVIGNVKEAAKTAIDQAPPNARFSVVQFSEKFQPITPDFTDDHNRVKRAIDRVKIADNTCLYDSAYDAIEMLEEKIENPQERRAIILFTDGRDEKRGSTEPCSLYNYDDVVGRARPRGAPNTPIHTIGLCDSAQCGNINKPELQSMALETSAFSAAGIQTDLDALFQEIMRGLNSQWVAWANVFPKEGENQAALIVRLRGRDEPLTATFPFYSSRAYNAPLAPVRAEIANLTYDEAEDVYSISLGIVSPETISKLIVQVWDEKSGTQVPPDQEFENPPATLDFERSTDNLSPGREYIFRVKAVDQEGLLIETENGESSTTLAEMIVLYEPSQSNAPETTIEAINADYETEELIIDLDIPDENAIERYEGFVVDEETGQKVATFEPKLFPGRRIIEPLPEVMKSGVGEPRGYPVTIYLLTQDGQRLKVVYSDFKPIPPEPPSFLQRVGIFIGNYVGLIIGVIALAMIGVVLFYYKSSDKKKEGPQLPKPYQEGGRPPVLKTQVGSLDDLEGVSSSPSSSPSPNRLHLKVVRAPNISPLPEKTVARFPCTIGRRGFDFNIEDPRVSRPHARITLQKDQFYLIDLDSKNGTFIDDERVEPNKPIPISTEGTTVRLGRQVYLELKPQG